MAGDGVSASAKRGRCPVCMYSYRLKADGRVQRHHGFCGHDPLPDCRGSGMMPLPRGLRRAHRIEQCAGEFCCIHNPSPHSMREWPLNIRFDRGIAERICPHGVGHPDPDDAAYRRALPGEYDDGTHGCDGCCWEAERRAADELTALTEELGLYGEVPPGTLP